MADQEDNEAKIAKALQLALHIVKPYTPGRDIRMFLTEVEYAIDATNLPWKLVLTVLHSRTDGRLQKWIHTHRSQLTNFTVTKHLILEHFGPTPLELTSAFQECRLEPGEDVRLYHDRFLNTLADLGIDASNALALHNYIQGLGELGAMVSMAKYTKIEDVRDAVVQLQGFMRHSSQPTSAHTVPQSPFTSLLSMGALLAQSQQFYSNAGTPPPTFAPSRPPGYISYAEPSSSPAQTFSGPVEGREPWKGKGTGYRSWGEGNGASHGYYGRGTPQQISGQHMYENRWQWATQPSQPLGWESQGFQGTQGRAYSSSGGGEDEVEAVRRELEEWKMRLAQQERHGDATNMVMMVPEVDTSVNSGGYHRYPSIPVYANEAQHPRNLGQLPTYDDFDMDGDGLRPRKAPPVGPRRAEDLGAIPLDVRLEMVQRLLGSRKYVVSIHELLALAGLPFQQKLVEGFNKCCMQDEQPPAAPQPTGARNPATTVHYMGDQQTAMCKQSINSGPFKVPGQAATNADVRKPLRRTSPPSPSSHCIRSPRPCRRSPVGGARWLRSRY